MGLFDFDDSLFDFNGDGTLDFFERSSRDDMIMEWYGFYDDDEEKKDAELDFDDDDF